MLPVAVLVGLALSVWPSPLSSDERPAPDPVRSVLSEPFDTLYSSTEPDDLTVALEAIAGAARDRHAELDGVTSTSLGYPDPVLFSLRGYQDLFLDQLHVLTTRAERALRTGDPELFVTYADRLAGYVPLLDRVASGTEFGRSVPIERVLSIHRQVTAIDRAIARFNQMHTARVTREDAYEQLQSVRGMVGRLYEEQPEVRGLYDDELGRIQQAQSRYAVGWRGFSFAAGYGTDFAGAGGALEGIVYVVPSLVAPEIRASSATLFDIWLSAGSNRGYGGMRSGFGFAWRLLGPERGPQGHYLGYHFSLGYLGHTTKKLYWPWEADGSESVRFAGPQLGPSYTYVHSHHVNTFVRAGLAFALSDAYAGFVERFAQGTIVVTVTGGIRLVFSEL